MVMNAAINERSEILCRTRIAGGPKNLWNNDLNVHRFPSAAEALMLPSSTVASFVKSSISCVALLCSSTAVS